MHPVQEMQHGSIRHARRCGPCRNGWPELSTLLQMRIRRPLQCAVLAEAPVDVWLHAKSVDWAHQEITETCGMQGRTGSVITASAE